MPVSLPQLSASTMMGAALLVYCGIVRYYRYQRLDELKRKFPDPEAILHDLDAAHAIYSDIFRREFPNVARTSLEFALFKTFVVPSVSKLLVSTKEFEKNCTRRAEDTELILSELIDMYPRIQNHLMEGNAVTEKDVQKQYQRSAQSIQRLNEIHGKYPIRNGDYLYTLSLFLAEPIRWINNYEWRSLDIREINAIFHVWSVIGRNMNIKDVPHTKEGLLKFKEEYEKTEIKYAPSNWKCALPTINHLLTRLPKFLWPIVHKFVGCLLEPQAVDAFGIPHPSWLTKLLFRFLVRSRALFIRYFCLPRNKFLLRTPFHPNEQGRYVPLYFLYEPKIYTKGYCIPELGPEKLLPASCPYSHLHNKE